MKRTLACTITNGCGKLAKLEIKGLGELALKLSQLGTQSDEIAKKAVYAGAKVVADKIRANLRGVLSIERTGDLERSLGISPIKVDKSGVINTRIGFSGYDRKGTANQLKARVLESGSSRQRKRPFFRTAVKSSKRLAQSEMQRVTEEEIKKRIR